MYIDLEINRKERETEIGRQKEERERERERWVDRQRLRIKEGRTVKKRIEKNRGDIQTERQRKYT